MKDKNAKPGGDKKKKKSSYKAKRSFTRNKTIRKDAPEKLGRGPYKKDYAEKDENGKPKRHFRGHFDKDKREGNKEKRSDRKEQFARKSEKVFSEKKFGGDKPAFSKEKKYESKTAGGKDQKKEFSEKKGSGSFYKKGAGSYRDKKKEEKKPTYAEKGLIRLNRYIANAGICSRREADDLIASGCVSVNGKIITELGYKVKDSDEVNYSGQRLKTEKHVYILLNKPKDYLTTAEDDRGRRTVMELIEGACKERVYPVGRLDRNTMGLLLFTNDGEMTKKLTHPKHLVQKLYHVELDKNLKQDDLLKIQNGVELEDGFIKPDEVSYAGESKREVGILIHSGRNRVVRRIFEQLSYEVVRLDRIMFAGLTKKELPRGRWRRLTDKEIAFLKMI